MGERGKLFTSFQNWSTQASMHNLHVLVSQKLPIFVMWKAAASKNRVKQDYSRKCSAWKDFLL